MISALSSCSRSRSPARNCAITIAFALFTCAASAQAAPPRSKAAPRVVTPARIDAAIAKVKAGAFTWDDIDAIAEDAPGRAAEVIPALEKMFRDNTDIYGKGTTASILVRLGDKDVTYWNYLVAKAIPAAEDDAPPVLGLDQNGNTAKKLSPQFVRWATSHNLTVNQAAEKEVFDIPGAIANLGSSRDPRAVPILREALYSANFLVVASAAEGLAGIGDKDSIPLIIQACGRFPADVAEMVAVPLVYFDDKDAQAAVDQYVPKERAADARKARAGGVDAYGSAPWR